MDSPERGRPELPDGEGLTEYVMVRLTKADIDALYQLARLRRTTASAIARALIRVELRTCPERKL